VKNNMKAAKMKIRRQSGVTAMAAAASGRKHGATAHLCRAWNARNRQALGRSGFIWKSNDMRKKSGVPTSRPPLCASFFASCARTTVHLAALRHRAFRERLKHLLRDVVVCLVAA
jgi:hypothetical protein